MILDILGKIVSPVIDKIFPDEEKAARAKVQLLEMQQKGDLAFIDSQAKVLVAEAQSESAITRTWRPITMLSFVFIILAHYFFIPFFNSIFGFHMPNIEIAPKLWSLMEIGIGGYVMGRSAVQGIEAWKKTK